MIARVELTNGVIAELDDAGVWFCDDMRTKELLNWKYNPHKEAFADSDGKFDALASLLPLGWNTIDRLRKDGLAKKVQRKPLPPLPEGAIV
jgi:hypothetical protein